MEIITEPSVYLIAQSALDMQCVRHFLHDEDTYWQYTEASGDGELIAELAGRTCYMSFGEKQGRKSTAEYLQNIIASHHGSVLEHAVFTFLITGVSRSFTHELVRHRAGTAFSQLSQRYVDESETNFVMPPLIQEVVDAHEPTPACKCWLKEEFEDAVQRAVNTYEDIAEALDGYLLEKNPDMPATVRRKRAREAARSVLPNATETKIVFTANARALRHIIELRGSQHADAEMRAVAKKILLAVRAEAPSVFADVRLGGGCVSVTESKV